jgi:two-component system, OmpR family, aerobic respiration control sensor histidine kinase ArcB
MCDDSCRALKQELAEIKKQNKHLLHQLQIADDIFSLLPNHVYWKDKEGVYQGCNNAQAKSLGFTLGSDVVGKTDTDLPWHAGAARFKKIDQKVMFSRKTMTAEEKSILPDGSRVVFYSTKTPLYDAANEVIGILGISVDITRLKQQEIELKHAKENAEIASQAKSEFIANMSHDIRTPITGMLGLTQDLLNTVTQIKTAPNIKLATDIVVPQDVHLLSELLEVVRRNAPLLLGATDELLQLLNEILDIASLESGKVTHHAEIFDVRDLMKHNIALLQPIAQHKKLNLTLDIDQTIPGKLYGLRAYFDRVLLNLIGNALKFTEVGFVKARVSLADVAEKENQKDNKVTLKLSVEDSGIGIHKDKFATIFERFTRLTSSYQGLYKGTGLGLYTVKCYVEAMGGKILLDSEVGQGSCFTVLLHFTVSDQIDRPRHLSHQQQLSENAATMVEKKITSVQSTISGDAIACILIVDDNALAAMAVAVMLKSCGCVTEVAEDGAQAIEKVRNKNYALIFMDIGLPDMTGAEVAKRIRAMKEKEKSQVPIVALTGHASDPERRQECLGAGIQEILSKPASVAVLQDTFQRFVVHGREV